jgi:hypothetical protein
MKAEGICNPGVARNYSSVFYGRGVELQDTDLVLITYGHIVNWISFTCITQFSADTVRGVTRALWPSRKLEAHMTSIMLLYDNA